MSLFYALEQTHCAFVECDCEWVSVTVACDSSVTTKQLAPSFLHPHPTTLLRFRWANCRVSKLSVSKLSVGLNYLDHTTADDGCLNSRHCKHFTLSPCRHLQHLKRRVLSSSSPLFTISMIDSSVSVCEYEVIVFSHSVQFPISLVDSSVSVCYYEVIVFSHSVEFPVSMIDSSVCVCGYEVIVFSRSVVH